MTESQAIRENLAIAAADIAQSQGIVIEDTEQCKHDLQGIVKWTAEYRMKPPVPIPSDVYIRGIVNEIIKFVETTAKADCESIQRLWKLDGIRKACITVAKDVDKGFDYLIRACASSFCILRIQRDMHQWRKEYKGDK